MCLITGVEGDDQIDFAAAEESRRRTRMACAVADAAAAKGMCASDSLRARAGEIEAALAASEAELDRQEAASWAATQVRGTCHSPVIALSLPHHVSRAPWIASYAMTTARFSTVTVSNGSGYTQKLVRPTDWMIPVCISVHVSALRMMR